MTGIDYRKKICVIDFTNCLVDLGYVFNNATREYMEVRKEDNLQILDDIIISTLQDYDGPDEHDVDFACSIGMDIMINVYSLADEDLDTIYNQYVQNVREVIMEHLPYLEYSKINVYAHRGIASLHIYS